MYFLKTDHGEHTGSLLTRMHNLGSQNIYDSTRMALSRRTSTETPIFFYRKALFERYRMDALLIGFRVINFACGQPTLGGEHKRQLT